jgi:pimeloyl-ACP methyl ester carboxylesterase
MRQTLHQVQVLKKRVELWHLCRVIDSRYQSSGHPAGLAAKTVVALLLGGLIMLRPSLAAAAPLERLDVPGFLRAVVVAPSSRTPSAPVAVALHGNFDRPSWQCEQWRQAVGNSWLLCPRGVARRDAPGMRRFTYRSAGRVEKEIGAAMQALSKRAQRQKGSAKIARWPRLLLGFSLGATHGSRLAVRYPARFSRVVLLEGGHTIWTAARCRAFRKAGGRAVVFGCGTRWCARRSRQICLRLRRAKVFCRFFYAPGLGHSYGPALIKRLQKTVRWLLHGSAANKKVK